MFVCVVLEALVEFILKILAGIGKQRDSSIKDCLGLCPGIHLIVY